MSKTNLGLVEYAKSKLNQPTIYMLGGFGRLLTQKMIDRRVNILKCSHTIPHQQIIQSGIGKACFDCCGLIKGYLWEERPGVVHYNIPKGSDQNVRMMYNDCPKKGDLKDMPDLPGLLVFTHNLGHVGIYVGKNEQGNRQYIESTPAWKKWGVTQSYDEIRKWTYWGRYKYIDYVSKETPTSLMPGDIVYVHGSGRSSSLGSGKTTPTYKNKRMKIIKHLPHAPYAYGCSTLTFAPEGEIGSRYITAYFKPESLFRQRQ